MEKDYNQRMALRETPYAVSDVVTVHNPQREVNGFEKIAVQTHRPVGGVGGHATRGVYKLQHTETGAHVTARAQRTSPLTLRRPSDKDGMIDVTTDKVEEPRSSLADPSAPAASAAVEVSDSEYKGEEVLAEEAVTPRSALGPHCHEVTVGQDGKMEKCYKCKAEGAQSTHGASTSTRSRKANGSADCAPRRM